MRPSTRNPQKYFKKLACFSERNQLVFPTKLSPQIHHDLPPISPRSARQKLKNPLQKRPIHHARKKI
jgi:hypothetical protein